MVEISELPPPYFFIEYDGVARLFCGDKKEKSDLNILHLPYNGKINYYSPLYRLHQPEINVSESSVVKKTEEEIPARASWIDTVNQTVSEIRMGPLQKVVLSRKVRTHFDGDSRNRLIERFQKLEGRFRYLFSIDNRSLWAGVTPERLFHLNFKTGVITAEAIAGTAISAADLLLNNIKDTHEQNLVVDFVKEQLEGLGATEITISEKETIPSQKIHHLKNVITGKFKEIPPIEKIIERLHPTPAVCGLPRDLAKEKIANCEPYERESYTGILGIVTDEEAELFVTIRCAKSYNNIIETFGGAGIVKGSEGAKEWNETSEKISPLLF